MGDPPSDGSKKSGIPSWQLKQDDASKADQAKPTDTEQPDTEPSSSSRSPERADLIVQAKKWIEAEDIRDAPTDKKIAFLEEKGLENRDIQQLLGVERNRNASSNDAKEPAQSTDTETQTRARQETPRRQEAPARQQEAPAAPISTVPAQPPRDTPPIITYPEFLTKPAEPAPIVTGRRLLTALYLFGSASFLCYGTSKYLIKPMVESLNSSRHMLAETAQSNLENFVNRLENLVSEVPKSATQQASEKEDHEDSDEDPTEMFHRDIGVQTSLPNSQSSSRPGSPGAEQKKSALDEHMGRLDVIKSHTQEILDISVKERENMEEMSGSIKEFRDYLQNMAFSSPSYGYGSTNMFGMASGNKDGEDEIAKVKAQIRSVKGTLLSARSFPGGVGRVR